MLRLAYSITCAFGLVVSAVVHCRGAVTENPLDVWEVVATPTNSLRGIAYHNDRFAAVGVGISRNIVVSTNGTNWSVVANGLSGFDGLRAVATGAGQFVAVGGPTGVILSSSDGLQWVRRYTLADTEFWAVIYAASQFVAVGFRNQGLAISATSPDGINWETFDTAINTTPQNIAYGNGKYVAAASPVSMLSTNGRNWTPIPSVPAVGVAFDGARFITTLMTNGFSSIDGTNWSSFPLPRLAPSGEQNYYTARYANGALIVAGQAGLNGVVVASIGGVPFTTNAVTESMGAIRDALFVDGHFYLADQSGKIWRSGYVAPATSPVFTGVSQLSGQMRMSFSTPAGFHYRVEAADRLDASEWQSLGKPAFAVGNEASVTNSILANQARFYRLRIH